MFIWSIIEYIDSYISIAQKFEFSSSFYNDFAFVAILIKNGKALIVTWDFSILLAISYF